MQKCRSRPRKRSRHNDGPPRLILVSEMDIEDWRRKIDDLDRGLVKLLSERAKAAIAIGKLKRDTLMPI